MVGGRDVSSRPANATGEDQQLLAVEILVGRVLFWGGLISILVVLAGFGLHLLKGPAGVSATVIAELTRPPAAGGQAPEVFTSWPQIVQGLSRRPIDPLAIIALGLAMLLATPVLAVLLSVPAFALIRDYRYAAITLIILVILAASFLIG